MSFANDILLFSRGDEISMQLLMDKFQEFSKSTGLVVNPAKCKIFCGGMDREQERCMTDIIGFDIGRLHIQYLGIPLESKRLSSKYCVQLVEKIGKRIRP